MGRYSRRRSPVKKPDATWIGPRLPKMASENGSEGDGNSTVETVKEIRAWGQGERAYGAIACTFFCYDSPAPTELAGKLETLCGGVCIPAQRETRFGSRVGPICTGQHTVKTLVSAGVSPSSSRHTHTHTRSHTRTPKGSSEGQKVNRRGRC